MELHVKKRGRKRILRDVYRDVSPPVAYCLQHGCMKYTFQIYVPVWIGDKTKINVIFAQWHGMPNGLLFKIPQNVTTSKYIVQGPLSPIDAASMWSRYGIKDGISASTPYAYVEQGGKPPLAIKFKDNKLQVACTGDSCRFSDKYVPGSDTKWKPSLSDDQHYKHQILYNGMPLDEFPLQGWVTFDVDVKWAQFTPGKEGVNQLGSVKVDMMDSKGTKNLVSGKDLFIGRNDILGYYFKFGCYRYSTEPFCIYTKGYKQY